MTANLAKLVTNSASVLAIAHGGLQATVQLNTSYGAIVISAGVPDDKVGAAVEAGLDTSQAQGEVWTPEGDGWCPKTLHGYGLDTILGLLEGPALEAWRAGPQDQQ